MKASRFFLSLLILTAVYVLNISSVFAQSKADRKFEKLMDEHWAVQLKQSPEFATSLGVRDYDHLLSDPSLEAYETSIEKSKVFLSRLSALSVSRLSQANQLNHALLLLDLTI